MRGAAALGVVLVAGHAAAFVQLVQEPAPAFEVTVTSAPASARRTLEGGVPPALRARVRREDDGRPADAAGLRRTRWRAEYRGGYARAVGATQLVGPFQDPAAPPCGGRVVVAQALLDDGAASAGTVAHVVRQLLQHQLADQGQFPIGEFGGVQALTLRWSELARHPEDATMFEARSAPPGQPLGYLRATALLTFERVQVPVVLALVPRVEDGRLAVSVSARARLAFGNRVAQWLSDHLGGDRLASAVTRRQLGEVLRTQLEPPPPLELPGGGQLRFAPCGTPQIVDGQHGALAFSVAISPLPGYPLHLPPRLSPPGARAPSAELAMSPGAQVSLELTLDAMNALLFGAWREGLLDRQLAAAGLVERFHADPLVATYLSLRLTPPRLTLPPVVTATGGGLRLESEAATTVQDGARQTLGRVWTAVQISEGSPATPLRAELAELELTCEARAHVLTPCYADLVQAMRARTSDFTQPMTDTLSGLLAELFAGRTLSTEGLPTTLHLLRTTPRLHVEAAQGQATLRLEFVAALRP